MLLFLAVGASAADPTPSSLHLPSAVARPAGTVDVGFAAGHVTWAFGDLVHFGGGGLHAGWAPTDRLRVEAAFAGGVAYRPACGEAFRCPEVASIDGLTGAMVSARFLAVSQPGFRLAPFVTGLVGVGPPGLGTYAPAVTGGGGVGVALEGGTEGVRVDASVLVALLAGTEVGSPWLPVGDVGLTFPLGRARRDSLRLALVEALAPDIGFRHEGRGWYVEAGVTGIPGWIGGERVEVGLTF